MPSNKETEQNKTNLLVKIDPLEDYLYWIGIPGAMQLCKLFVLDGNTWYHITVYKQIVG